MGHLLEVGRLLEARHLLEIRTNCLKGGHWSEVGHLSEIMPGVGIHPSRILEETSARASQSDVEIR